MKGIFLEKDPMEEFTKERIQGLNKLLQLRVLM
jgi:hypothetical protein